MSIDKEIGARVRVLREGSKNEDGRKLTLRNVAEALDMSHTFIGDLERGDKRWLFEYVEKFADYYNVPASLLTDPSIPLEQIQQIAEILEELSELPSDKLAAILQMLRAMK